MTNDINSDEFEKNEHPEDGISEPESPPDYGASVGQEAAGYVDDSAYTPSQGYPESIPEPATPVLVNQPRVRRFVKEQGKPGRFIFADMSGVLLLVWIPVLAAFFIPWKNFLGQAVIIGDINITHVIVALIIAIGPWFVLLNHLRKGRLLDGILDMFLWAIWESLAVITLCFFYREQASEIFWSSASYWQEMREWLVTGEGAEGTPSIWILDHLKHFIILMVASIVFGLPALMLGVLQLNYMNFYVANCMLASDNPLLVGFVAWHIWSIVRVAGFITIASTIFHAVLGVIARVHWTAKQFALGLTFGVLLVILDGILKWQMAESLRQAIISLVEL